MSRFFGFGCEIAFACGSCIGCTAKGMTCPACLVQPRQEPQSKPTSQPKPKTRDVSSLCVLLCFCVCFMCFCAFLCGFAWFFMFSRVFGCFCALGARPHNMMTCPGFLALAVRLLLPVVLALAAPQKGWHVPRVWSSQGKSHSQNQHHSQSQKPGTCHHYVFSCAFVYVLCVFAHFCAVLHDFSCFSVFLVVFVLLGRSWALVGHSWAFSGRSWPLLGRSWALLGRSWQLLGRSWALSGRSWEALVAILSLSCKNLQKTSKKSKKAPKFWTQLGRQNGAKIIKNRC